MEDFINIVKQQKTETLVAKDLEKITENFPFFQLPKTLLLKKYHQQEHFKYNYALKNTAAYTTDRTVLFDFINLLEINKIISKKNDVEITGVETPVDVVKTIAEKPFAFTTNEKHSFQQWLQLSDQKPIERKKSEPKKINSKLQIINEFIKNNPKISPIKKSVPTNNTLQIKDLDVSNEMMTETLARIYVAQKKYTNAIQAYKILSLKYPEKSSLFADQIEKIKILQNHKS